MNSLPYRATIFLRPAALPCGQVELMERNFAKEADAVFWCNVMTEADPQASGVWFVAVEKGGRMMGVTQQHGLLAAALDGSGADDDLSSVLAGAGIGGDELTRQLELELVGSA